MSKKDPRVNIFRDVADMINSSYIDMDSLLDTLILIATRSMEAKASSILLVDHKTRKLYFHLATGDKKDEVKRFELNMGEGIAGWVAESGTPLLVPDVAKDPRWDPTVSDKTGFSTQSIACAPMKVGGNVIGVIEIIDKMGSGSLTEEDLEMLLAFADLAARVIESAQKYTKLDSENKRLADALDSKHKIVGESDAIKRILADTSKIAYSKATALITGESGTGKELIARLIHNASPRREKPFLVLNCGALPETLLERELFGHEKGSFTGADRMKIGLFEAADTGTLFLDEVGDMAPAMQVKLLRALQEGVITRIGGVSPIHVDVRIISATNRDLEDLVAKKQFREDLYYRLNVVRIRVPALRERIEDIPMLATHFLEKLRATTARVPTQIAKEAMDRMMRYGWPGNIRQLENAIERAVILGNGRELRPEDLPLDIQPASGDSVEVGMSLKDAQEAFKRDFVKKTLSVTHGNKTQASKILDIQRTYLSRLIRELDIE